MGLLGCPTTYTALVAVKDTGMILGELQATSASWSRVVDDVSEALVTVAIQDQNCCDIIGQVNPWHHEIQLYRDGKYVWGGIVVTPTVGRTAATFACKDILGLLNERVIHDPLCFSTACGGAPGDLTDLGIAIIQNALIVDGHNYEIVSEPTGIFGERLYSPGENALTDLQEALGLGLDCTALGRRIILGPANGGAPFGRTATLTCDDFAGDLQVEIDGLNGATRVIVMGNGFIGIAVAPGADENGNHPYYGLIEFIDSSQSDINSQEEADAAAARVLLSKFPPPATLISTSALATTAPVDINDLVPGTFTDVIVDCTCRPFAGTQVLMKIDVAWDSNGETVTPTFGTIYQIESTEYA